MVFNGSIDFSLILHCKSFAKVFEKIKFYLLTERLDCVIVIKRDAI